MTTLSEVKGRKVVSLASALSVGQIADFVIDPSGPTVVALTLKKAESDHETLPWANITAFGEDAVTVADDSRLIAAEGALAALADKAHAMDGKRVLDDLGEELGEVADLEFDLATGSVLTLLLKGGETVEGKRLVATGSYAVIVKS